MVKQNRSKQQTLDETKNLKSRLAETEETLRAIQEYMVDAFVVNREKGIEVVTLNGSEIPYRRMVEAMNEGAVTLIPDGTIFYCNFRFGEMLQENPENLIGTPFQNLILPAEQDHFKQIMTQSEQEGTRGEFRLQRASGKSMPVQLSVYKLGTDNASGLAVIATDISERVQAEKKIRSLASKLTLVEQEERHHISQILHDDLQQRLFAIKTQLSFLKDYFEKGRISAEAYSELDQIRDSLSEAIALTRNLSVDLNPVVLHGEGLTESITWLSFRMKEQYGLHVDLKAKENFDHLDHHLRVLLFQAIRELLFNVVKHAGVLEATITMERRNRHDRITVSDEGKGFDAETVLKDVKLAHGLLIVQDRLSLLDCHMEVISKPGEGTRVLIELPMERTPA